MHEIPFEALHGLRWHCTTTRHMMFVGHFAGEQVLLKAPRDDLSTGEFKDTVRG